MNKTKLVDDDPMVLSVEQILRSTRKSAIGARERDLAISAFKMSRETHRRLVTIGNLKPRDPGELPRNTLWGIPIVFDEEIPVGEVKEQYESNKTIQGPTP